eukprot:CAMPEP_0113439586 /NCGR_PEP_ID=MMETSP0014_2-20120614/115_1 /TAXON_ID=2857 /ORGANISM="Nitzschia sp." /LENGTH=195 /DNA_ID=CAMNT_0000330347 /DNA_START=218 /DNA_END=806 /DNA_ORIENTATION=+ /assembly_acc=CAM_ASM_000159
MFEANNYTRSSSNGTIDGLKYVGPTAGNAALLADPAMVWLESVFRGFTKDGLQTFLQHSCVPSTHESFCNGKRERARKRCIVVHHEVGLVKQFIRHNVSNKVLGLFPGRVPGHVIEEQRIRKRNNNFIFPTWVNNAWFWKEELVDNLDFPAAKVNRNDMVLTTNSTLLDKCTNYLDRSWLEQLEYVDGITRTIKY